MEPPDDNALRKILAKPDGREDAADLASHLLVTRRALTERTLERDSARAIARVLAHAYTTDNRPPRHMVAEALAFPVILELARTWPATGRKG